MKNIPKTLLGDGVLYWGFPILSALLLNGILIAFIPGLVSPLSDRNPDVKSIPGFRMVRIKPPVPAVESRIFPKTSEPARAPKTPPEVTKAEITPTEKLTLPLDLKSRLPKFLLTAKALPVIDFTLPALPQLKTAVQRPPVKASTLKSFYTPDEIDRPLLALVRIPPVYPRSAKRRGIQGWVDVVYSINRSGGVEKVQIVKAMPQGVYEKSVLQAVSGWRFSPGTVNGKPVTIRVKQRLRFELSHDRN